MKDTGPNGKCGSVSATSIFLTLNYKHLIILAACVKPIYDGVIAINSHFVLHFDSHHNLWEMKNCFHQWRYRVVNYLFCRWDSMKHISLAGNRIREFRSYKKMVRQLSVTADVYKAVILSSYIVNLKCFHATDYFTSCHLPL